MTATSATTGTTHAALQAWVDEVAALTTPDKVVWSTDPTRRSKRLNEELVAAGTFVKLDEEQEAELVLGASPTPATSRASRTAPSSAPRTGEDAGFTNNWMAPAEMKAIMTDLYQGVHDGPHDVRHPLRHGPPGRRHPNVGVEITDSAYVVVSMKIMARIGARAARDGGPTASFVKGLHSVGAPLSRGPGRRQVAVQRHQVHRALPRDPRDLVLRLRLRRQRPARQEVLRAAHRLGHGPRRGLDGRAHAHPQAHLPEARTHYIAGAFPSACGKTNLAMIDPTLEGWKAEMVGDDIAWMRFGKDGRLYAVNPEFGLFGVAPGTGDHTNPNAMRTIEKGNSIFTNVALTDDGDVWWEGMTEEKPAHLTDWKGRDWTPESGDDQGLQPPELAASAPRPSSAR
jgi:phosphoenolpyruvate carboxykinase (GTP)